MDADTHWDMLATLNAWGVAINPLAVLHTRVADCLAFYDEAVARRAELPYDIDGVVYKVNRLDWQDRLARSAAPRAGLLPTSSQPNRPRP